LVWKEIKSLPGDTVAKVEAYVVPQSGVGWIDFDWGFRFALRTRHFVRPEHRRILADWTKRDQSSVVREVIKLADEWFIYCHAVAEREVAAAALAAHQPEYQSPMGPVGVTGPSSLSGISAPPVLTREILEAMRSGGGASGGLSTPDAGQQAVQGVFVPFAGETVFGTAESTSDGLSDLGYHVSEPQVGR
jgi:hypothetical protein